jgi:hypothetical protein
MWPETPSLVPRVGGAAYWSSAASRGVGARPQGARLVFPDQYGPLRT